MKLCVRISVFVSSAVLAFGMAAVPVPAEAQSLFETLFGAQPAGRPLPASAAAGRHRPAPLGGINAGQAYNARPVSPATRRDDGEDDRLATTSERHGRHQTVCVRLCDGYYWPVSYAAPRSRFYRDANVCSAACGAEAKLFHFPTNGGQIQDAVDLTGRVYSRLPNAFRYRKALRDGCTCKPAPWTAAEQDRHRNYALAEHVKSTDDTPTVGPSQLPVLPVPQPSGPHARVLARAATEADDTLPVQPADAADGTRPADGPPVGRPPRKVGAHRPVATPAARTATAMRTARRPAVVVMPTVKVANSSVPWSLTQPSSLTWPGDAPRRVR